MMIHKLIQRLRTFQHTFQRNEDGVTAIEYSVLIALISGSLFITLPLVGANISNPMSELAYAIDNGGASSGDDGEGESDSDDVASDDDGGDHGDDDGGDDGDDDEGDDDDHDDGDDDGEEGGSEYS